jgi:hypothetical protein
MKTGKRLLSAVGLLMFVAVINAQPGQGQGQPGSRVQRTPEETAKAQVEWMKTELKFNEATQKKVYEVVLKYARQSSDERQKIMASGDRNAMRAKMTEINSARDKELKVILGDKNFAIYKTKEAERRQGMMQQRPN